MLQPYLKKLIASVQYPSLWILISISSLFLFLCSSLKHSVYKSTAFDLGIFDQALYLISQGKAPFSSLTGWHILADHAAFILYPLSLLYWIYPDVHWLLMVQAIALSFACYPAFKLALQAGLTRSQGMVVSTVCLLYPVVFRINLFDFHPEVIALPSILWMVLAARSRHIGAFCIALLITLGCKDALSLTVAAIGLWMIFFETRKKYGFLSFSAGIAWFFIASKVVIPTFYPEEVVSVSRYLDRYSELGGSAQEILQNTFVQPQLMLSRIFSFETFGYLFLLCLPVIYIFLAGNMSPLLQLVPAVPTLIMNILANSDAGVHRDLAYQYSLPIIPFLLLAVIACFQERHFSFFSGRRGRITIITWAVASFLILARPISFFESYNDSIDRLQATEQAVARVRGDGSVLTTAEIVPHLSHRSLIEIAYADRDPNLARFDTVLLDTNRPGWMSNETFSMSLVSQLNYDDEFRLDYEQDGVYLFIRNTAN